MFKPLVLTLLVLATTGFQIQKRMCDHPAPPEGMHYVCAPHNAAPWRMLSPTPPQPTTTTLSPGRTGDVYIAAPTPVAAAQPTSAAALSGASWRIGMQLGSGTTANSAKLASPQ